MAKQSAVSVGCKPQIGYPMPSASNVTTKDILNNHYFMTDEEWERNRHQGNYDYVIIGSSFCALAFVTQALKNNPDAKVLLIERGDFLLQDHFQNLPHAFANTVDDPSETFHWSIAKETHEENEYIKWQHGMYNFVGGRSSFWSGWCPQPTREEMESWPSEIRKVVQDYFPDAKKMLNIISADDIFKDVKSADHKPIFGELQRRVQKLLKEASRSCEAVTHVIPAPLAVEAKTNRYEYYSKYCVVGPLLQLLNKEVPPSTAMRQSKQPQVHAVIDCLVKKINHEGKRAAELETSKGKFTLGKAKLILAMGTLPSTTLVLNSCQKSSFPLLRQVGERFTAHFMSCITARVPLQMFNQVNLGSIELGAVYVKGEHKTTHRQFHIQITAIRDDNPEENVHHRVRHLPDYFASPSFEQLQGSKDHVVFVCACLGELDHDNDKNWYRLLETDNVDVTCNATLQVIPNQNDEDLWNTMDQSTFQLLEHISSTSPGDLEYWHNNGESGFWNNSYPKPKQIRHEGLVHEASTMRIGGDADAPVGLDYCLRGTNNVYVTGASLWPTAGSWNPVGTIVSMAMHLADQVCKPSRL